MGEGAVWSTTVSRENGPLHVQIARAISAAIDDGRLAPGDRLPPERELAASFGVNRLTVRQALGDLHHRRLIRRVTGRNGGTFVADVVVDYNLSNFAGFTSLVERAGRVASAKVLSTEERGATDLSAESLQLSPGDPVYVIDRLRLADDVPVLVEHSVFSARRFPDLLGHPLTGSLYELLADRYGARVTRAVESVEPAAADPETARLFGVARGQPLLAVTRVAYDAAGTPVEFARDTLYADRARAVSWSVSLDAGGSRS